MSTALTFTGPNGAEPMQALADFLHSWEPTPETMTYAGDRQITRIKLRTQAGQDVDGKPFQPYSSQYAKVRAKRGRNVTPVDLTMSGRLLNSMRVEVRGTNVFAITVADPDAAVYGEAISEGLGHQPERRFFDTNATELDAMGQDAIAFSKATK